MTGFYNHGLEPDNLLAFCRPRVEQAPPQDLRCIGRYGLLFACPGSAIVGEDGTVRVVDYPVRQAWVLPGK